MEPKAFFDRFTALLGASPYREECISSYCNSHAFTKAIMKLIDKVIETDEDAVGRSHEYYRVDAVSWRNRVHEIEQEAPQGFHPYLWDLQVAVEHENCSGYWMDEVIKLAHINCPLRVVIGYVPVSEEQASYIDCVSSGLRKLGCRQALGSEFLLLIGNSATRREEEFFHYKLYLFDGEAFRLQSDWAS